MYLLKPGKSQPFISHNVKADTIIPNTFDISLFSSEIFPGFIIGFRKEYNTVRNKPYPLCLQCFIQTTSHFIHSSIATGYVKSFFFQPVFWMNIKKIH